MPTRHTAELVSAFSRTFAGQYLTKHAIASPLGLWLLLATLAPAATGQTRTELENLLGTTAEEAAARAGELTKTGHPAVGAAVAVWADRERLNDTYQAWAAGLAEGIETRPSVPSQEAADNWAFRRTRGLIGRFPVTLSPETVLVLASALVTTIKWTQPFDDATPADLAGPFGQDAHGALAAPDGHERFLAYTPAAGIVGVHAAASADGLQVISVIGDPDTTPADMHVAVTQVARLVTGRGTEGASKLGLWDTRLGTGHAWTVTEADEPIVGAGPNGKAEVVDAILPAWQAKTDLDLADGPGMGAAFATLEQFLRPASRPAAFDARQVSVASYRKDGFEAASVTAVAMRCAAAMPRLVPVRRATIRFNRPYAVLAVATNRGLNPARPWSTTDLGCPAWDGVPVFSAWVTVPD